MSGALSEAFAETPREVFAVGEATGAGDALYRPIGAQEQFLGAGEAAALEPRQQGLADLFAKKMGEV